MYQVEENGSNVAVLNDNNDVVMVVPEIKKNEFIDIITKIRKTKPKESYFIQDVRSSKDKTKIYFIGYKNDDIFYIDFVTKQFHLPNGMPFKRYYFNLISSEVIYADNSTWENKFVNYVFSRFTLNESYSGTMARTYLKELTPDLISFYEKLAKSNVFLSLSNVSKKSINWEEKKLHKMINLPLKLLKAYKDRTYSIGLSELQSRYRRWNDDNVLHILYFILETYPEVSSGQLFILENSKGYGQNERKSDFFQLTQEYNYDWKTLVDYIFRGFTLQGIDQIEDGLTTLRDYVRMNEDLENKGYKKYPLYLKTFHDITARNYKLKEDEVTDKKFNDLYEKYKHLEYSNKEYSFICPKESREIINEGNSLSHCVASYVKGIVKEETYIMFLRHTNEKEKSLVTVAIDKVGDNDYKLIQAEGFGRRKPKLKEKEFLREVEKNRPIEIERI
jgi:hypothetical protein